MRSGQVTPRLKAEPERCESTSELVKDCGCSLHARRRPRKKAAKASKRKPRGPKSYKAEADKLFSQLIRSRGYCERCGKGGRLETSHIYSRRYASVRCDPLNAKCLCSSCHRWWHDKPVDAVSWLHEDMSAASLRELRDRAVSGAKVDWAAKVVELRALLAEAA